ncbi:peroxidase [Paragonimus westermani]|uniref:Peroxidase n=1 Tax=Paragonimus westermani TaxID=34504 RepID=A0A5J4P168_9TREM|nr:peroxidase [Paragonimus westermani]
MSGIRKSPLVLTLIVFLGHLISSEPITHCPKGCSCIGQTITCTSAGLRTVPKMPNFVPGSNGGALQFLMFGQNPMIRLERASFENQMNLIRIELSFNQLVWISKDAFIGLPSLRSLSMRGNRIAYLPHEVFTPVYMLEDLDLSRNQIKSIPFSLEGLIYLKRLSLFGNPIYCPCELVDFTLSLVQLEPVRARVTCQGPPEVAQVQLTDLAKRMMTVVSNTRLLGYQAMNESEKDEFIRTQPFVPRPRQLRHAWPWPHCPVRDFGGFEPRSLETQSEEESEQESSKDDRLLYQDRPIELPQWRNKPKSVEVVAGDVTRFLCGADGHKNLQITWILPENATTHIRLHRRRQFLEIYETHNYHQGLYTCVISSKNGQHMSADATLRLVPAVKPQITDAPPADNNMVREGTDLELRCSSYGRPRPRISWLWQEETLPLQLVTGGRYIVRSAASGIENPMPDGSSVYSFDKYAIADVEASETHSFLVIRNVTKQDAHGRYICYASNQVGSARVSTIIQVVTADEVFQPQEGNSPGGSREQMIKETGEDKKLTGDDLVRHVIEMARVRIEDAIKKTADRLRDPSRRRSSADVASLFRQPSRAALELAKAAEVYEAAIDEVTSILRQRNHQNLELNMTEVATDYTGRDERDPHSRDALGVQLSADQLAIISQLSGCQESSSFDPCSQQLCFHLRYRSIDGACNNFNHPRWGAALAPFKRLLPPQYENGINTPVGWTPTRLYFGYPKPSARLVSRELLGNATLLARHTERLRALDDWNKNILLQGEKNESSQSKMLDSMTRNERFEQSRFNMMRFERQFGSLFDEDDKASGMLMQWGQFLDHDLDFTPVDASISRFSDGLNCNETCLNDPPCFPILVPPGDPRIKHRCIGFARSSATCGSGSTSILLGKPHHREQLNQITSFIDGSNVYGSEEFENSQLRETLHDEGKMRMGMPTQSGKRLLPFNIRGQVDCQADPQQDFVPCFKAGDHRSNENLGLLSMHTIWVREHNRLADGLRSLNPDWSGDRVYQEVRKIVGACMQAITYQVWLPMILGPTGMEMLGTYTDYDDHVNPTISNEFATAAMRFGHTLIPPVVFRLDENWNPIPEGHLHLHQAFFAPERMMKDGGMDPILRGLLYNGVRDRSRNPPLNAELTERLFAMAHELALDLASLNIQRGRDHGLPGYSEYAYKFCGLGSSPYPESFEDFSSRISSKDTRERLRKVYGHPGNVDLFAGAVLEDLLPEARVGPTFACIIVDQFKRLRSGDRFWYEARGVFTSAQLAEIRRAGSSLSRVICETADNITEVPINAFLRPKVATDMISCSEIPKLNLAAWVECPVNLFEGNRFEPSRVRRRRSVDVDQQLLSCSAVKNDYESEVEKLKGKLSELEAAVATLTRKVDKLPQERP